MILSMRLIVDALLALELGQEQRHAVEGTFRVARAGAGQQQDPVGVLCIRDPDLAAVDEIAVALLLREGLEPRGVDAVVGLAHPEAHHLLAAGQFRQELLLHLLRAVVDDRSRRKDVVLEDRVGIEAAALAEFVEDDAHLGQAEPHAAVFLGHQHAQPAAFGERILEVPRVLLVLVLLAPVVEVELLGDLADRVADQVEFGLRPDGMFVNSVFRSALDRDEVERRQRLEGRQVAQRFRRGSGRGSRGA